VDQFFWGERLSALGVGPPAIPQRALSVQKLVQALQQAVLDPGYSQRAGQLAQAIRKEDGVLSAVEIIRQQVH
jgi:UDP:flavonoid glycosyltransferase YjiC (YdhE family)